MSGVLVDVASRQVMRDAYYTVVCNLQPQQAELLDIYARAMPRPVHDDFIFMRFWQNSENPKTVLKVYIHHLNKKLAPLNLMLRRSRDFGYMLVDCADWEEQFAQITSQEIVEALRG